MFKIVIFSLFKLLFKHCNEDWTKMKKKEILRNSCRYEIVKDTLQPTNISPNSPLQKQRKLLQKVQVGKGIISA